MLHPWTFCLPLGLSVTTGMARYRLHSESMAGSPTQDGLLLRRRTSSIQLFPESRPRRLHMAFPSLLPKRLGMVQRRARRGAKIRCAVRPGRMRHELEVIRFLSCRDAVQPSSRALAGTLWQAGRCQEAFCVAADISSCLAASLLCHPPSAGGKGQAKGRRRACVCVCDGIQPATSDAAACDFPASRHHCSLAHASPPTQTLQLFAGFYATSALTGPLRCRIDVVPKVNSGGSKWEKEEIGIHVWWWSSGYDRVG